METSTNRGIPKPLTSNGIEMGYTKTRKIELKDWIGMEEEQIRDWDDFFDMKGTVELVKNLTPTRFYVYFTGYLVYRFVEVSKELAVLYNIDIAMTEWKNEVKSCICQEIEDYWTVGEVAETPGVDRFVKVIIERFIDNQYYKGNDSRKLRSCIVPGRYEWNEESIRDLLMCSKIEDSDFLNLAIGISMDVEDAELFMTKVLQRTSFHPFSKMELLAYICLKYAEGNKREFLKELENAYKDAKPTEGIKISPEFNTRLYMQRADEILEKIRDTEMVFDNDASIVEKIKPLFSEIKYLISQDGGHAYHRTANREFVRLYKEFRDICREDLSKWTQPEKDGMQEEGYSKGKVNVIYKAGKSLHIPEGHCFYVEQKSENGFNHKKTYYVEKGQAVNIEESKENTVKVHVKCTEETEVYKDIEKETGFLPTHASTIKTDAAYVSKIENKSKFKANGKVGTRTCIEGNLDVTCILSKMREYKIIPAGTVFADCKSGYRYVSTEDVDVSAAMVTVQVHGTEEAKVHEVSRIEHLEDTDNIIRIDGESIKYTDHPEKNGSKISVCRHRLSGRLDQYLYDRSAGSTLFGREIEESDADYKLRETLLVILKDTDIDFNNLPRRAESEYKTDDTMVSRTALITMAFLVEMAKEQFSDGIAGTVEPEVRIANRLQRINEILINCGYYEVYYANPYDCLLLYISTFEDEPLDVFRNLWGVLQDYVTEKNRSARVAAKERSR